MISPIFAPLENMTPFGVWLATRFPHCTTKADCWGDPKHKVFRIHWPGMSFRHCLFDYTFVHGAGRITIFGKVYKKWGRKSEIFPGQLIWEGPPR